MTKHSTNGFDAFAGFPTDLVKEVLGTIATKDQTPKRIQPGQRYFPSLFISDMHLGAHSCQADALLSFLECHVADTIYLVGDIFDIWRPIGSNWKPVHHKIVNLLLDRMRSGVRIVYTPGNHDEFFRHYFGEYFGNLTVADYVYHTTSNGTKFLVIHGDCVDLFERKAPVLSKLGAHAENLLRGVQLLVNRGLTAFGREDWCGVDRLVAFGNRMVRANESFQIRLADLARTHEADGIVCGHFHQSALHDDHGIIYANCGDWTENCTALAETASGQLMMLDWSAHSALARKEARAATRSDASVTARA